MSAPHRRTFSVLSIARRHPRLFSLLLAAASVKGRA